MTKQDLTISKIDRPIGIALLPNGNIVIGVTGKDSVNIFNDKGMDEAKITR